MALQGSPPFAAAGSPPRLINGQPDHLFHPPVYNPQRPMLPPSPQQFARYQPLPLNHHAPLSGPLSDMKALPTHPPAPPTTLHKRPGSSMSISSMLESGPERSNHELPHMQNHHSHRPMSVITSGMPVPVMMSPPLQSAKAGMPEYSPKRSQTPDRLDHGFVGNRHRSASGTSMLLHRPTYEPLDRYSKPPTPHSATVPQFGGPLSRDEQDAEVRRTSISSILQRPNSQPQAAAAPPPPPPPPPPPLSRTFDPLPPQRNNWYADPPQPAQEPPRTNGYSGSYDTKPPGFRDFPKTVPASQASPSLPAPSSVSPDMRRSNTTGSSFRSNVLGLLNGPTSQPADHSAASAHSMLRQDSSHSQSDRSLHAEQHRFRHFSPFSSALTPHNYASGRLDEQSRKGSDEASHKTILGLGVDNRRSRYSPVPQAVQGAQAHTPVPDGGVQSEQGKVFSGIGGGIGSSTTPVPLSNSPFKSSQNSDGAGRPSDGLKMSRTTSSIGKRSRKQEDELDHDGKKSASAKANKRTKYQNSYKADLEEMAHPTFQRRSTPLVGSSTPRNPLNGSATGHAATRYDIAPIFRPKKTVKVATVVAQTLRKPRRHLGTFQYDADVFVPESYTTGDEDFELCIKPKIPAPFSADDHLNCTYTVHVSKHWLQDRERRLITATRNLWGTGIYTDDSDPIIAAMHMGWIKPAFHNVDQSLLQKIVQDQNPPVDLGKDLQLPLHPLEIPKDRGLKITCLVMPQLDRYEETARFGIRSRSWPEGGERTPHDGVSFAILKVEVVDVGPLERKLGRTGKSKRAWLQAQLYQRERAGRLEKERVLRVLKRAHERAKKQNRA